VTDLGVSDTVIEWAALAWLKAGDRAAIKA
jgi:hypothetical protein